MTDMIGKKANKEVAVVFENTAKALSSNLEEVFSTPHLVVLVEDTCRSILEPELEEGQGTVGTKVDISHMAATPVGMKVRCEAEVIEADGKRFLFKVEAFDNAGKVAEGTHERFIIKKEKFMQRAMQKLENFK